MTAEGAKAPHQAAAGLSHACGTASSAGLTGQGNEHRPKCLANVPPIAQSSGVAHGYQRTPQNPR